MYKKNEKSLRSLPTVQTGKSMRETQPDTEVNQKSGTRPNFPPKENKQKR